MNDREKLIELIESARYWGSNTSAEIADHLIANEVVIQKQAEWIEIDRRSGHGVCSNCNRLDGIDSLATHCRYCGSKMKEVK